MKTTYCALIMVFFMAFIFGLAGCQPEGTGEKAGKKMDKATESTGEYMSDAAITTKIKAEILGDPLLKVFQIDVTTTNGVVELSGRVDSQEGIDRAMRIARSIKDVKSVNNYLVR